MANDLSRDELEALQGFAKYYGKNWKAALRAAWQGQRYKGLWVDDGGTLRNLRNRLGPSWLIRFRLPVVKWAAYGDLAIYGLGDSPDGAIADARQCANEPEAEFETAPISDEFHAWILEHGGNVAFGIDAKGYLYNRTDE